MFCDCETANLIERGKNSINSDTALTRQQPAAGIPFDCEFDRERQEFHKFGYSADATAASSWYSICLFLDPPAHLDRG